MPESPQVAECVPIPATDFAALVGIRRGEANRFRRHRRRCPTGGRAVGRVRGGGHPRPGAVARRPRCWKAPRASSKTFAPRPAFPPPPIAASATPDAAKAFADSLGFPVVIKADGLAAGKGVIIAASQSRKRQGHRLHVRRRLRRQRPRDRGRGIHGRRGGQLLRPVATARTSFRWPAPRITSAWATATPAPTPAAWAPIRPRRC